MFPGFGYAVTYEVVRHVQNHELDRALWLVNGEQVKLQQEKSVSDDTLALLENPALELLQDKRMKPRMTIGEVAQITNVETSAIRHWEKEGLITPERNAENGYRLYTPDHIRQILLIRSLRRTVFYLHKIKEVMQALQFQSIAQAKKVVREALSVIHHRNRQQYNGVHKLMELCIEVGAIESESASMLAPIHTFDPDREC
ncbi:transcriptional regulator, MerR family [Paenibacillus sp. JCM 10914]|nr:transcriptional regulator, MerR family [Paenibacillus sp. JCM 10914]